MNKLISSCIDVIFYGGLFVVCGGISLAIILLTDNITPVQAVCAIALGGLGFLTGCVEYQRGQG